MIVRGLHTAWHMAMGFMGFPTRLLPRPVDRPVILELDRAHLGLAGYATQLGVRISKKRE